MKVAFFSNSMHRGSFSAVFSGLAHGLVENGVTSIEAVTLEGDIEAAENPFPPQVSQCQLRARGSAAAIWPLKGYLEHSQPDVLISGPILPNLAATSAKLLARRWRGVLILSHHHPIRLARSQTWKNNELLVRFLYRFADGSFGVNPVARQEAIEVARLDPNRVACIPNARPPALAAAGNTPLHPWLANDRPRSPVFVTASRLEPVKNIALLIDAFAEMADEADAKLLILGGGTQRDELQAHIEEAGLQSRASLLGRVPSLRLYLREADAFVLASNEEGFGQVLSEAMGEGLPVISTDAAGGGPRFVLNDGAAGILVPCGDRSALASAMAAMADPALRQHYATLALERAERFSPGQVGRELLAFLQRVSANGSRGRGNAAASRESSGSESPQRLGYDEESRRDG